MAEEVAVAQEPSGLDQVFEEMDNQGESVVESAADAGTQATEDPTTGAIEVEAAPTEETDYLPTEQEKVFPEEVLAKYSKRYPGLAKVLSDPNADQETKASARQILHDKINSDIEIQRQKTLSQAADEEVEETADEPTVQAAQLPVADRFQVIDNYLRTSSDPKLEVQFADEFLTAFGNDPTQFQPEAKQKFARTMAKFAMNLMWDAVPGFVFGQGPDGKSAFQQQVGSYLDSEFEGLRDIHKDQSRSSAWNSIKESDTKYANLPAYGSKQWQESMKQVEEAIPNFGSFKFTDKAGKIVSPYKNFVEKSKIAARVMAGVQIKPEQAKQLQAAATKQARDAQRSASLGKSLGAGQSKGQIVSRPATNNDDIFGSVGEVKLNTRLG